MADTTLPYSGQQRTSKEKKTIVVTIVVIVAVLIGGILIFRQPKKTDQTKGVSVENKQPSPTEKPKVDKKSVKIQVLNGTGTPGQAGTAVDALENAGYDPDNIKSANAEEFSTTDTTITAKEGFDDVARDIKEALKETFDEININSTALDDTSEFDIVVTTGGKKYEEETTPTPTDSTTSPTETPTPTPTVTPTPSPTPI